MHLVPNYIFRDIIDLRVDQRKKMVRFDKSTLALSGVGLLFATCASEQQVSWSVEYTLVQMVVHKVIIVITFKNQLRERCSGPG